MHDTDIVLSDMKKNLLQSFARICLMVLLLFSAGTNCKAEDGVVVTLKDGQVVNFLFSSKPCVMTTEAELLITTADGQRLSYDYSEVSSVRFGNGESTGVKEAPAQDISEVSFKIISGVLNVYDLPVGENVSVYTLNGHRIGTQSQQKDGEVLSIPLKANGVLVVRTSTGVSYRILNK